MRLFLFILFMLLCLCKFLTYFESYVFMFCSSDVLHGRFEVSVPIGRSDSRDLLIARSLVLHFRVVCYGKHALRGGFRMCDFNFYFISVLSVHLPPSCIAAYRTQPDGNGWKPRRSEGSAEGSHQVRDLRPTHCLSSFNFKKSVNCVYIYVKEILRGN